MASLALCGSQVCEAAKKQSGEGNKKSPEANKLAVEGAEAAKKQEFDKAVDLFKKAAAMNEGHSAFLALERIRLNVVEKKLDFYSALQVVAAANVFTTHTPVPAGNDSFSREMMQKYFGKFAKELNIPFEELFSFGHTRLNPDEPFSMTVLALRLSRHANGVSKLHGEVSRSLWKDVWSGVPTHGLERRTRRFS